MNNEYLLTFIINDDNCEEAALKKTIKNLKKETKELTEKVQVIIKSDFSREVKGDYVSVITAGDYLTSGAVAGLVAAAEQEKNDVIFLSRSKIGKDFEEKKDDKFSGYRSIFDEPYFVPLKGDGLTIKKELLRDGIRCLYDRSMLITENIIEAVLRAGGYYKITDAALKVNKREDEEILRVNTEWIESICELSQEKYGEVTGFLQYALLAMAWTEIDAEGHNGTTDKILDLVSDKTVISLRSTGFHGRLYLLNRKHGQDILKKMIADRSGKVSFAGEHLFDICSTYRIKIDVTNLKGGIMTLEGTTDLSLLKGGQICWGEKGSRNLNLVETYDFHVADEKTKIGESLLAGTRFKAEIPIEKGKKYGLYFIDRHDNRYQLRPGLGAYSKLNRSSKHSYFVKDEFIVQAKDKDFVVKGNSGFARFLSEAKYLFDLVTKGKVSSAVYRLLYRFSKIGQKKPVWIVADRPHIANDNGEHMFRYLMQTEAAEENDIYFMISKESPDYERLCSIGPVLDHDSLKHKMKFLNASVIISAAANNLAINAFGKNGRYYRDLYDFDFVYLRHGVSHNDQSHWLNRLNKNMRILVATCKPEYKGILEGEYLYTEREVKLTGLPRFDNLTDAREKKIAILPTWRKNLEGALIPRSSKRAYIEDFKETDYFRFYNSLMNDERLLDAMREHGFTADFYLHPVFEAQADDFTGNDLITIGNGVADYQKVFRESSIMITDFSSVAFDFAYLKKPVIYSQFDADTFYKYHSWGKGYFTYDKDGFGPITKDVESTVDEIIRFMENDCRMDPEYVEKVDNFFAYTDRNNCRRVYDAIKEIRNGD